MGSSASIGHNVVSREEWLKARKALLEKEKAWTRERDALAAERLAMPWVRIETNYRFDGKEGQVSLSDMFGSHRQLFVYHFMYGEDWEAGCKSCSLWADSINGSLPHLSAHDLRLVCVSKAPLDTLLHYRERMGWQLPWYSSANTTFNEDFHVSFPPNVVEAQNGTYNYQDNRPVIGELPGLSAFYKDADGTVLHTYSCYARGLEPFNATYGLLDLAPLGRNEQDLDFTMAWVKRHDEY